MINRMRPQEQQWNNVQRYLMNLPNKSPQKIHPDPYNQPPLFTNIEKENQNFVRNMYPFLHPGQSRTYKPKEIHLSAPKNHNSPKETTPTIP